jgi:hypothetical protein
MADSKNVSIWYLKLVNGEFHEVGWSRRTKRKGQAAGSRPSALESGCEDDSEAAKNLRAPG